MHARLERDRDLLQAAHARGRGATLRAYLRLSGPGWLQSAVTLGGGSLAGSLYLGVLAGNSLLWLQPFAMICGIVMLSAISYVALSTEASPFRAINQHVNPVLGWGWAVATLLASVVWALPQFALGTAAVQQNLLPDLAGVGGRVLICGVMLAVATAVVWGYDRGTRGIRVFESLLKSMVATIVVSFVGVVVVMGWAGGLNWPAIGAGFVPDIGMLWRPAPTFDSALAAVDPTFRGFWERRIVADQRDVMVTAAATAVGVNMTFLLPYSMRARGWGREFRGLARFDLAIGLLLPFVLATSCVVIAAASQFHAHADTDLLAREDAPAALVAQFDRMVSERAAAEGIKASRVSPADRELASMLVRRDAFQLARSLEPLTGRAVAHTVFGIGVLGMALSTVIILMLISGFVICEMSGREPSGWTRRWGSLAAAIGVLGPFVWSGDVQFWLAVPTSVFGFVLLPIAYWSFFLLLNSRRVLGSDMPRGLTRVAGNLLMLAALAASTLGAAWSVWSKSGWVGAATVLAFATLALVVGHRRRRVR